MCLHSRPWSEPAGAAQVLREETVALETPAVARLVLVERADLAGPARVALRVAEEAREDRGVEQVPAEAGAMRRCSCQLS